MQHRTPNGSQQRALSLLAFVPTRAPPPRMRSFMRFPGGCYIEGDWMRNAFRWKDTVGPNEERPGHLNGEVEVDSRRRRTLVHIPSLAPSHMPGGCARLARLRKDTRHASEPAGLLLVVLCGTACRRVGILVHRRPGPV